MTNDLALLAARLTLGTSIAAHGAQKAVGWFEGPGPEGATEIMESLGFRPGMRFAGAAYATEIAAGALIDLGLGGPVGPAMLLSTMIVAGTSAHLKNGYFMRKGGIELTVIYSAAALALAAAGNGRFSLDAVLGLDERPNHWFTGLAIAGAVAGALSVLSQRESGAEAAGTAPGSDGDAAVVDERWGDDPDNAEHADAGVRPAAG